MKLLERKPDCCGCSACFNICPTKAIKMLADNEGFSYPVIDTEQCIECGMCKKVCPILNRTPQPEKVPQNIYGAKNRDTSVRVKSTSGGVFSLLSSAVINNNGVVYGVSFDNAMRVVHSRADTIEKTELFRGSKYVQSDLSDIFTQVLKDLENGLYVLFSGTPCQCDGLKNFLELKKVDFSKLILCDMVCHGVPSPMVWEDFVNKISGEKKLKNFLFRDKNIGWHGANIRAVYEDKSEESNTPLLRGFTSLYFSNLISRPSCEECLYTNFDRCSDITIADFWGIERTNPDFDDNKGVSLILINTKKGERIFFDIKDSLDYFESDAESCIQEQLEKPQKASKKRERFWKLYSSKGLTFVLNRYGRCGLYGRMRRLARKIIKGIFTSGRKQ